MVDVRRAYGRWLKRRLLWLVPSLVLSCAVFINLAVHPDLPDWVRIPSLALVIGVAGVFAALSAQTLIVLRERARGRRRRAQLLRRELRPYPGIGLVSLLLLLVLLAVPMLFPEPPPVSSPSIRRRPSPTVRTVGAADVAELPVAAIPSTEGPGGVPQILPEIVRLPELPLLWDELEPPARPAPQDDAAAGSDRFGMKHRPGIDDLGFLPTATERRIFDRAGVPSEFDPEGWMAPALRLEVMIVSFSGPWRGGALETAVDFPFGRDDSFRLAHSGMFLSNEDSLHGLQPSLSWHRGTVEYVRRVAGYTRGATFDLAFRIGMTVDLLKTHDAGVRFDSSSRVSPWFALESAIWEDDGVGLIVQAGHSPATRLTGSSSKVTDIRVLVRIDLGEQSSIELGYRMISARFRDRSGAPDEYADRMDRSFKGPVAAVTLRF